MSEYTAEQIEAHFLAHYKIIDLLYDKIRSGGRFVDWSSIEVEDGVVSWSEGEWTDDSSLPLKTLLEGSETDIRVAFRDQQLKAERERENAQEKLRLVREKSELIRARRILREAGEL